MYSSYVNKTDISYTSVGLMDFRHCQTGAFHNLEQLTREGTAYVIMYREVVCYSENVFLVKTVCTL